MIFSRIVASLEVVGADSMLMRVEFFFSLPYLCRPCFRSVGVGRRGLGNMDEGDSEFADFPGYQLSLQRIC